MMDFLLKDNDISVANGDIMLCSDDEESIAQAIVIRLKTMAGEWFLDSTKGLPYLTAIFGHKRSERFMRQVIMPEIEAIAGIKAVSDFRADMKNDRSLHISFTASLPNKTITISEAIGFAR